MFKKELLKALFKKVGITAKEFYSKKGIELPNNMLFRYWFYQSKHLNYTLYLRTFSLLRYLDPSIDERKMLELCKPEIKDEILKIKELEEEFIASPNNELETLSVKWAEDRDMIKYSNLITQCLKLGEAHGKLSQSISKEEEDSFRSSVGDMIMALVILTQMKNTTINECWNLAYSQIINHKGKSK